MKSGMPAASCRKLRDAVSLFDVCWIDIYDGDRFFCFRTGQPAVVRSGRARLPRRPESP